MDFTKLSEWVGRASAATLLALALAGYFGGFWVSGSQYNEAKADRDEWKRLALAGTNLASTAAGRTPAAILHDVPLPVPLPSNADKDIIKERLRDLERIINPPLVK